LALNVENLVPNFWTCKNGAVGTSLAPFVTALAATTNTDAL